MTSSSSSSGIPTPVHSPRPVTRRRIVSSLRFLEDGTVVIEWYETPTDIRNRGLLQAMHQLAVQRGEDGRDYGDEIDDVHDAAQRLLGDALEDFASTPAQVPDQPPREDDDDDD